MLQKIEQIQGLKKLSKSAQNSVNGGRNTLTEADSRWCDFVFNHCHNMYDSDAAYMNCMRAGNCEHEA